MCPNVIPILYLCGIILKYCVMKVTSATVRLVIKKLKLNKNGESPIYLSVCFHGRLEKSTGISINPKFWDEKREIIKSSAPNAPVLNKMLQDMKNKVIERKNEFEYQKRVYTPSMLLQDIETDFNGASNVFKRVMDRLIEERRLRDGTVRGYTYTYRKLCEYLNRKDFIVDELVLGVVKDFATWLEKNNIKINTIKKVLGCIAATWNYAIERKIVTGNDYPFNEFKYTLKYKEVPRDYYLEKSHIARLKEYWLNLVIERDGNRWHYREGAEDKLRNRCSKEFGILWFLLCYRYGGAAPADVAYLRPESFERVYVEGVDCWKITFRRKKTSVEVKYIVKRDIMSIISIEHFLGTSGHFVYPILHWHEGITDKNLLDQAHKANEKAIKHIRNAFLDINEDIAKDNVRNGSDEPLIEVGKVVMYTARHSRASNYLDTPGATVSALASMMGRSSNTIATYVHRIQHNKEVLKFDEDCIV